MHQHQVGFLEFLTLAIFHDGENFSSGHFQILIGPLFINDGLHLQDIDNVYYETEYRREWCSSKSKPSPCFLFARKFTKPTTLRLLNMVSIHVTSLVSSFFNIKSYFFDCLPNFILFKFYNKSFYIHVSW